MFKLKSNYPQSFFTGAILRSKASLKQTTCILRVCLQIRGCSYKSLEFVNDLNTKKKTKKHGIYATQVVPLWVQLSWCFLLGAHFCQHQIWDPPPIGRPALPQVFSTTFRQGKTQKGMPRNVKDTVDEIQQKNMLFRIPNCLWVPS